jgi:hypothetical protein
MTDNNKEKKRMKKNRWRRKKIGHGPFSSLPLLCSFGHFGYIADAAASIPLWTFALCCWGIGQMAHFPLHCPLGHKMGLNGREEEEEKMNKEKEGGEGYLYGYGWRRWK